MLVKDDIKEIYWAFCSRKLKDDSALQNPLSSEGKEDLAQWLQLWEYILREKGLHVLLDEGRAGVWVFSLEQAVDEEIIQTSGLGGLECELFIAPYWVLSLTRVSRHISWVHTLRRPYHSYVFQSANSSYHQNGALSPVISYSN